MEEHEITSSSQTIDCSCNSVCNHSIIEDYIDIDPEKSLKIFYCEYCLETFDTGSVA